MRARRKVLLLAPLLAAAALAFAGDAAEPVRLGRDLRRPLFNRLFGRCYDKRLLEDGWRAVSVPLPARELRHVRVGDRVDVLSTFSVSQGVAKRAMTATLLQDVRVLGVDEDALVLKLNPHQAQYAALGARQSDLSIALRKDGDADIHPMEMATFDKLFR